MSFVGYINIKRRRPDSDDLVLTDRAPLAPDAGAAFMVSNRGQDLMDLRVAGTSAASTNTNTTTSTSTSTNFALGRRVTSRNERVTGAGVKARAPVSLGQRFEEVPSDLEEDDHGTPPLVCPFPHCPESLVTKTRRALP